MTLIRSRPTLRSLPTVRAGRPVALRSLILIGAAALAAGCARATTSAPTSRIDSGSALLRAMRERYDGAWYRTVVFTQQTTQASPSTGAEQRTTWHEALAVPNRLRIDTDFEKAAGQLFARDSQFVVVNGTLRRAAAGHNVLLVLGFDVYAQPPARTADILGKLGFPLGAVREDTWQGRPAYVVGGRGASDTHSHQFWVDRERLVFVRLLQPWPGDTTKTFEVRFNKYRPLAGGWISPEVEGFVDGKRTLLEEYTDIQANVALPDGLFDPRRWKAERYWR